MADIFQVSPADEIIPVDISAGDQIFSPPLRGIVVGVAGDVSVEMVRGITPQLLKSAHLAVGIQHGYAIKRIYQAGTTATDVLGIR